MELSSYIDSLINLCVKGVFKDMKIKIYVGPTWIRIPCDKQGLIDGIYDLGSFIKDN